MKKNALVVPAESKGKPLQFRPYARLLTMLGDQLIKNERIALIELIKNCYDADATWVKVTFENFTPTFGMGADSKIIIEDDGLGMTRDVIENHWVNPATPVKWVGKQGTPTTKRGRVVQGEKGIGRFALLKLGKKVEFSTRAKGESLEHRCTLDLSEYDENFIPKGKPPLFLDMIKLDLKDVKPPEVIKPQAIVLGSRDVKRANHGTRIEISHLKSEWSEAKVRKVFDDLSRLQTIFEADDEESESRVSDFEVCIFRNDENLPYATELRTRMQHLLNDQAVFRVEEGRYDNTKQEFSFKMNGVAKTLSLKNDFGGLTIFRKHFKPDDKTDVLASRALQCGSFGFAFYLFDLAADSSNKHHLDGDDKKLVREHRVYLYRDRIRVYPYGDPDDDWLGTDVYRGIVRASEFMSNDQVVGYVNITQKGNAKLQDKTNREGLIDIGYAYEDFYAVLRTFLAWLRKIPYDQYLIKNKASKQAEVYKKQQVEQALTGAWEAAKDAQPEVRTKLAEAATLYKTEKRYLVQRAENTEHLAGVGLSVETASHDLMVAMSNSLSLIDTLVAQASKAGPLNKDLVKQDLTTLRGSLSFIRDQMKDIQQLFRSTKQKRKDIRISDVMAKVQRLFSVALIRAKIDVEIEVIGAPLVAKTTDAVVLQLLLNLFDNSLYWLTGRDEPRKICITLDGDEGAMIFSDNGPGISKEDAPLIFEPFFSGKGQEGRGLGLYIARQLLDRQGYRIDLADARAHKILSGANLVISFVTEEE